jgi:zinc protease
MKTSLPITLLSIIGLCMTTSQTTAQETLDRTKRPGPGPLPSITLPSIQKATLKNGLSLWLVEQHNLPQVTCNLVILSGTGDDRVEMPGVADMTARMLDEGTSTMDALTIADKLETIGASLRVYAGVDATSAMLTTLTKHLDEALAVYGAVVTDPVFPEKEVSRLKQQRLTEILQQKDRAAITASLAFNRIIYGPMHPRGNDQGGTDKSIRAMTRDDIASFYTLHYRPARSVLILVGDMTLADAVQKFEKVFERWQPATVPAHLSNPVPLPAERIVYLIDKPAAPQTEIRIGYPALARSTPDYFPVLVMNRILGGQFSSRINLNLRERRGLTYGARSEFQFSKEPGPFVASGGFVSTKSDTAIEQLLFEIDAMHRLGMTAEELAFAKKGITGGFALSFETPSQIAGALQSIVVYGLPEDYYQNYITNVDRVTLDDVRRVAAKYLDSSKMAIVAVGDLASIRQGIEKLHLGTTVLCDAQGDRLP